MKSKRTVMIVCGGIILAAAAVAVAIGTNLGARFGLTGETISSVPAGPAPKIVADERVFDFGSMGARSQKEHTFVIRNEGEGPLRLGTLKIDCKCTEGHIEDRKEYLQPGESARINVKWEPEKKDAAFQQKIRLFTNDPVTPEFVMVIKGAVDLMFEIEPETKWDFGKLTEEQPTILHGMIRSAMVDQFKIVRVETSSPRIKVETEPMKKDQLIHHRAKSGYDVRVIVSPEFPVGPVHEKVTVFTDINGETKTEWLLDGMRPGPYEIQPMAGAIWSSRLMTLQMTRFNAAEGQSNTLLMLVTGMKENEELKFLDVKSDDPNLKVQLKPVKSGPNIANQKGRRYFLTFEVPKGSPPVVHNDANPVKVTVATNHPNAPQLVFSVQYIAN